MTGAEALTMLMARLGGRTNTTLRANILLEMKQTQKRLERGPFLPWFLITDDDSLTLTANSRIRALPTNFLRELDEEGLVEIQDEDDEWVSCTKEDYDYLYGKYGSDETSELPLEYALVGSDLHFFPIPEVASPIRLSYYGAATDIADDSSEPAWLKYAADWIMGETGIIVASLHVREDADVVGYFTSLAKAGRDAVYAAHIARQEANTNRNMGEPE